MSTFHALMIALAVGHGADVYTTLTCSTPTARCNEANPLVSDPNKHPRLFTTEVAAEVGVEMYILHRLHKNHPRLAYGLLISGLVVEGWAVQNNIRVKRNGAR